MSYYSKASYEATKKYKQNNIKKVALEMQKADFERLKVAAFAKGESVNGFIKKSINERILKEFGNDFEEMVKAEAGKAGKAN